MAAGSASPAETQPRSEDRSSLPIFCTAARYAVGAVTSTVTWCLPTAPNSSGGVALSSSSTDAPTRSGKTRMPPSP